MSKIKEALLQQAIGYFENLLSELKQDQEDLVSSIQDQQDTIDLQEQSVHDEAAGQIERENQQYIRVEKELRVLKNLLPEKAAQKVELGAIVETNMLNFFVSVPHSDLSIDGVKYVGISLEAPIYQAMEGKQKGDSFDFQQKTYHISNIY